MDVLTTEQRRLNMSRIRSRNTKPEITVRRALHAEGLRFRLHRRDLPGTPDLVFPKQRVAIFIHGCFWHGHACLLYKAPSTRPEFWMNKLGRNRERDMENNRKLQNLKWRVLTIWECALRGRGRIGVDEVTARTFKFLQTDGVSSEICGG